MINLSDDVDKKYVISALAPESASIAETVRILVVQCPEYDI